MSLPKIRRQRVFQAFSVAGGCLGALCTVNCIVNMYYTYNIHDIQYNMYIYNSNNNIHVIVSGLVAVVQGRPHRYILYTGI